MLRRILRSILCFSLLFQLSACGMDGLDNISDLLDISAEKSEADKLLYYAISENPNLEAVKEAVEQGADVNRLQAYLGKDNVLYYYSMEHMGEDGFYNHTGIDVATYLLENGADANYVLEDGVNLLMYSCGAFSVSGAGIDTLFDLLLDAGANVNATDDTGLSALDYAIQCNSVHKVKRLLACGASYDSETLLRGLTTYHDSEDANTILRKVEVATALLTDSIQSNGTSHPSEDGISFCIDAVKGDTAALISQLEKVRLDFSEEIPYTLSLLIAARNNLDAVRALEDSGCTFTTDHLVSAISGGNYEVAVYLQKSLIPSLDALRLAIRFGQAPLTQYFLSLSERDGLLTSSDDAELGTLLVDAVCSGSLDTVRVLYEYGAPYSPDACYHALQESIYRDQPEILSYLIDNANCDVNYYIDGMWSLFELAIMHGNYDTFLVLADDDSLNLQADNSYLSDAIIKDNNAAVQYLLNMGLDPNSGDSENNPLVEAICSGNIEAMNLLIDAGANVNGKLVYAGETAEGYVEYFSYPIHEAARGFSSRILKRLIEAGAQTDLVDSDGKTPLDLALTSANCQVLE